MNPEPLKNQIAYATKIVMKDTDDTTYDLEGDIPFFIPKRVKSAVEWFKEKREKLIQDYNNGIIKDLDEFVIKEESLINKAFEDVMK